MLAHHLRDHRAQAAEGTVLLDSHDGARGSGGLNHGLGVKRLDAIHVEHRCRNALLGQQVGGKIITNDYNLNKVAQLRGVEVLNINELSNAVKPVVIPGETMRVTIVKSGKEPGQGVAYLDDGTMIVVENGNRHMNESITVEVTSALQTAAGRMIFAKPAH